MCVCVGNNINDTGHFQASIYSIVCCCSYKAEGALESMLAGWEAATPQADWVFLNEECSMWKWKKFKDISDKDNNAMY